MTAISIINALGSLGTLNTGATAGLIILCVGFAVERILRGSADFVRAMKGKK